MLQEAWERRNKEDGTPLSKYYAQYRKKRDAEQQREIADRGRVSVLACIAGF